MASQNHATSGLLALHPLYLVIVRCAELNGGRANAAESKCHTQAEQGNGYTCRRRPHQKAKVKLWSADDERLELGGIKRHEQGHGHDARHASANGIHLQ